MNNGQKILTVVCVVLLILTLFNVPCRYRALIPEGDPNYVGKYTPKYYGEDKSMPIWNIKSIWSIGNVHYNLEKVNYNSLFIQWAVLLLSYAGLFFVLKNKKPSAQEQPSGQSHNRLS